MDEIARMKAPEPFVLIKDDELPFPEASRLPDNVKFLEPKVTTPLVSFKLFVTVTFSDKVIPPLPLRVNLLTLLENNPVGNVNALPLANSISAEAPEASILPPEKEIAPPEYVNLLFKVMFPAMVSVPDALSIIKYGKLSFLEIV